MYASIEKLQIMRLWTLWRLRQGIVIVHTDYNDAAIRWATERFKWERGLKINKPNTPDAPAKFNGFGDKWRSFSDGFFYMMSAIRGTMNIPLSYLFREHVVPTPEIGLVTALLHGIEVPKYNSSVVFILGSPQLRHDFQSAYNYLETVHQFSNSGIMGKKGFDRNVSGVSTAGDATADGRVPKEVWNAMSDKERKALLNKRKAARKGGSGNRGGNNNSVQNGGVKLTKGQKKKVAQFRKLEEVATSLMETLDAMGQEVGKGSTSVTKRSTGSQSEQFGRKVKEARRLLQSVTGKRVDDDDDE
jgi:hypothetical protein